VTWHTGRLCAFDLETTAPDPTEARIVTACIVYVGGGRPVQVREWLVDPGVEIPAGATAVHGITTEQARAAGMDAAGAVREIHDELAAAWAGGVPVVVFNAAYDLTVVACELDRNNDEEQFAVAGPVVDPFVIDREVDKYRKGKRTLGAMVEHYRVTLDGAHTAAGDALAAARVAWRIATLFPEVAALPLGELHRAQAVWHAERQADFAAYLKRTGKPTDDVSGDWPLRVRESTG
jgi:DNA polymerase-3 subunit epsilon